MGVVWFLIMELFLTAYDRKMEGYGSRFVELLTAICFEREVFGGGVGDKTRVWMGRPRMVTPLNARKPTATRGACFECGIEWLSWHKAEIVCHKKVVRILLPHGKILRFLGEKPEEKVRYLMSAKAEEQKLKDIIIVRNFPRYFLKTYQDYRLPENLSFGIDLILGAMPVLKSPYRLAPFKIEELSSQLRELYDKGFIRPSLSPWGAPGEEQKEAFHISKDKLCNVPVLALPDGLEDLVVYCDALGLGLGCVLMQREMLRGLDKQMECRSDGAWLTKSSHFLPICEEFKMDRLARIYLNEIVAMHDVPILIICDRDSHFTSRFWQSMQEALGTSVRCVSFEASYRRKCRSPILWAEVKEGQLIGHEIVQETIGKISQIKDRLKAAHDHQKAIDRIRKPLEFSVGDHVLLKVSP
nr:putative reverse transcriptase domain-containing protein [Tanacetum cinerariifolium]